MSEDSILEKLIPLVGGNDNISFRHIRDGQIFLRLKDQSLLDATALQGLGEIAGWTLKNGQLKVTLPEHLKEVDPMANNKQIAQEVLKVIGGRENVANVTHCITRLRLNLRDDRLADKDALKKIDGVMSVVPAPGPLHPPQAALAFAAPLDSPPY